MQSMGATYHCGIRVPAAYNREMDKLYDPALTQPFRLYVIPRWRRKGRKQLWKMGERIERKVFWEEDGNSPLSLFLAAWRWLTTTALIVTVDQQLDEDGKPINFPFNMFRITLGSRRSLVTLEALKKDPWHIKNVAQLLTANNLPTDAGQRRSSMDLTMVAQLNEYRTALDREGKPRMPLVFGLLAQVCQFAEVNGAELWFTILSRFGYRTIVSMTEVPWTEFEGVSKEWLPYFGSRGSKPFWCDFQAWMVWLANERPELFKRLMRDGEADVFAFEPVYGKRKNYAQAA